MGNLNTLAITRLASVVVHMQTVDGTQTLYTVPPGKTAFVSHVVVHGPTGSLAGGTDFDFSDWRQTVDLSSMTAATDYMIIAGADVTKYTQLDASDIFQITPATGATADVDATMDVFGYLV